MTSPGPAPRLGPRGHVEVKRTRKSTASTATLEPLDKGLALHSSASAELPTLRRQKGASAVSLHREKVYEECSIEIQDSRNLPNSVPGNVSGKAPIQTAKRSHSESRSDLQRQTSGASLEPQWIKDKKPLSRDWRVAAARAVEDRALRQRKQVSISLSQGELEVKEQDGRALPRQGTAAFQAPQRELTAYEKVCFENRLLPKFMTKVKDAVSGPVLDLCSCGLGDDQLVAVFADSELVPWPQIRRWRLRDARMRDRGAQHLAKILKEVEALDLTKNEIGFLGARSLADALEEKSFEQLRRLDLSANILHDDAASCLASALKNCDGLLRLDLQQNALQDGQHLGELIAGHSQLTRISLRRNRITGPGMAALFRGILENVRNGGQLADVDVAWNPMASDGLPAAKAMAQVFQESATLYHCDLSYCQLDFAACAALGEGLRDNHSLYGLHVVGNSATMDADGFLTPVESSKISQGTEAGVRFGGPQAGPEVRKCESLAIADEEKDVSSPFLRVSWDNMMQTSFVLKNTVRPTFNHTFYFPVRFFNEKITSRKYLETAFLYEMRSKGDIQIQVWHHDDASSTSLGFTTVSLVSVLQSNHEIKCTLRGRVKTGRDAAEGEELDVPRSAAGAWYDQERAVRWFDGSRTPLVGCQIANPNQPLLHFEAFFYPAWPTDFHGLTEFAQEEVDALDWPKKEAAFIQRNETFAENFAGPFPDSIGAKRCVALGQMGDIRSFPCIGLHPMNLEPLPLMAFLAETTVSQDYIQPAKLLHWMHCITYTMSTKQERTGMIYKEMWKDPQYLLFSRKGSPQDHAILLCSVLLGMSRDAYVVKGTIQVPTAMSKPKLVEHVWVMTREDGGWVTFWEASTQEFYHLPNRWVETKKKVLAEPKVQKTNEEDEEEEDETTLAIQDFTSHEVGDVMVELDGVPTVGRGPRPKAKAKLGRDLVKQQMLETQRFLPTAPKSQLLGEQSLVDWLPYDSIDVVFNKTQLWANRQNQHPACITYNFEDSYPISEAQEATGTWMTLLSDEERSNYSIRYVTDNVLMEPSLKHSQLRQLESQLVTESQENLRLLRGRIGKDTIFDHRPQLLEQLDQFLHIHEEIATLDVDFCPLWDTDSAKWNDAESYLARLLAPHFQERFNKFGTAFNQPDRKGKYRYYTTVQAAEQKGWHQVLAKIRSFKEGKSVFPTMKGKVFGGFPLHFSSADKDLIRDYVMKSSEYQELIHQHDDSIFTIHCHIFPLPGGISSTWLFFGTQSPLKDS